MRQRFVGSLNDGSIVKAHWRQIGVAAEARRCCPKMSFTRSQSVNVSCQHGKYVKFPTLFFKVNSVLQKLFHQEQVGNERARLLCSTQNAKC